MISIWNNPKDLYDAEQQLIQALPKMAKASSSAELRGAFEEHLEKPKSPLDALKPFSREWEEKAKGPKCKAMEGLVKEGSAVITEDMEDRVKDAALIAAAQRLNITKWLDSAASGGMPVCSATPRLRPFSRRHWKRKR
jgi:ferritin-like metal-binding protein YciE